MKYILTTIENEARLREKNPHSYNSDVEYRIENGEYSAWQDFEQTAIAASRVILNPNPNKSEYDQSELVPAWQIQNTKGWSMITAHEYEIYKDSNAILRQVWLYQPLKADGEKVFKGTPGKWHYDEYEDIITDEYGQIFVASFYNGVLDGGIEYDIDADPYNKHLIAAAPELLEALQSAVHELELYIPVTNVEVLDKCYAAIKKALNQ